MILPKRSREEGERRGRRNAKKGEERGATHLLVTREGEG